MTKNVNALQSKEKELTEKLNYHNKKCCVDDSPEISDFEFDTMLREFEKAVSDS